MNAQDLRGARLVSVRTIQHPFDEPLFKLPDGFIKQNSPLHHLAHKPFQLILHGTLQRETRNR
jgi:hypothetical protein